jgi:hypothetical protein
MHAPRIVASLLASTLVLSCHGEPTVYAATGRAPVLDLGGNGAGTSVEIKSEHLTGTLPNGVAVDVNLKVDAQGADPSSLAGNGRHYASTGAHSYWPATGSTDGTTVTLAGAVSESNTAFLIGSPVSVVADASTQAIRLSFGPLAGGPFVNQTLVFSGLGRVTITSTP